MAKNSKKGATSSHTISAKGGCLQHNRRTQLSQNVYPERTKLNTSWESDTIKNRKQLRGLKERAEKLYTEKTGQKCQKSFAPYKESCVVIKDSSTLEEAKAFALMVEEGIPGIECLGIWIHKDEGHYKSKYTEGDRDFQCNVHAHFLWYCQNPNTGKAIPIKRQDMRNMQDWAAASFCMERGNPAELTKKRHIPSMEYKQKAMEERLDNMQAVLDSMEDFKNLKANPISVKEDFSLLSKEQQVSLLQELKQIASEPARQEEKKTVVFSTEGRTLTIGEETATINLRGRDFDASGILSEFKRINVDWRSISPSKIESLLRGKEITLVSRERQLSLRLQKGIGGYVLKSALSVVTTITEAGANER